VPDDPLQAIHREQQGGGTEKNLGTNPRVRYAGLDEEVR
jgi:hypothetical protein